MTHDDQIYVYGPVPSRRLGRSLGIDPVPLKTCNWNCIYCQLGYSQPVVRRRQAYCPTDAILRQTRQALERFAGQIDWVTFVGSGETTLHSDIGRLISEVKDMTDLPVAVITNGSLLNDPKVREELLPADAVLPSLDAGSAELYRRINRPAAEFTFELQLAGLEAFAEQFQGRLWVEVMLVAGLNDTEPALLDLAEALSRIKPDQVHLLTPTRPPVEPWVQVPSDEGMMRAAAILGKTTEVVTPAGAEFVLTGTDDPVEEIVSVIVRHPIRNEELERVLTKSIPDQAETVLRAIGNSGRVQTVTRYGTDYLVSAVSAFREDTM